MGLSRVSDTPPTSAKILDDNGDLLPNSVVPTSMFVGVDMCRMGTARCEDVGTVSDQVGE